MHLTYQAQDSDTAGRDGLDEVEALVRVILDEELSLGWASDDVSCLRAEISRISSRIAAACRGLRRTELETLEPIAQRGDRRSEI